MGSEVSKPPQVISSYGLRSRSVNPPVSHPTDNAAAVNPPVSPPTDNAADTPMEEEDSLPPVTNPSKVTSNYRLRSREINPQGHGVTDKRKLAGDTWRLNTTKGAAKKARTADKNSHWLGDNGGHTRRHRDTPAPQEVKLDHDQPAPSQSTPGSQPEHYSPCPATPMDFCPAPTVKRPRGVELDFDEGNLSKASRVDPQLDDEMDLDCGTIYNQVADSGFIHSLSLV